MINYHQSFKQWLLNHNHHLEYKQFLDIENNVLFEGIDPVYAAQPIKRLATIKGYKRLTQKVNLYCSYIRHQAVCHG